MLLEISTGILVTKLSMKSKHLTRISGLKTKSCGAPIMGYQEIYFINSKTMNADTDFDPKSDSKADIKRAFTKSLKGKSNNKKILSSFISQIA